MLRKKDSAAQLSADERLIDKLREELRSADSVVIGAGAGLSVSAGFTYTGERFHRYFQDFIDRYQFPDMYCGGFYPFETLEEHWAYWSRYIYINRYMDAPRPVYRKLLELVKDRDYFVLTTNVDHCFQKAGFDKKRLFYTQGDYGLFQCSVPCHQRTYDNEDAVRQMVEWQRLEQQKGQQQEQQGQHKEQQRGRRIPSEMIPRCPVCGKPMSMNLRADHTFVEDEGWHLAAKRYSEFLGSRRNRKILFLELGTGMNTPGIIKYPFWQMTDEWPEAVYACVNLGEAFAPAEIREKSLCINEDIGDVLEQLLMWEVGRSITHV